MVVAVLVSSRLHLCIFSVSFVSVTVVSDCCVRGYLGVYAYIIQQDDVLCCHVDFRRQNSDSIFTYASFFHIDTHIYICCIGSFVFLHPELVGGLIDFTTSLFFEHSCRPHCNFTDFPISFTFRPLSSALVLEFALARDVSLFPSISSSSFFRE